MGDPKKQRRKYSAPRHPWEIGRMEEEAKLVDKYGLKNKKEIWRTKSTIGRFRQEARVLLGSGGEHVEKERNQLLGKLDRLGIPMDNTLERVLALGIEDLLNRRLQTIVFEKGLAQTTKQARQFVTHGHVMIGERVVDVPSYIVSKGEEDKIELKGIEVTKVEQKGREDREHQ